MKKCVGFIILLSISLSAYAAPVTYNWYGTISDAAGSTEDATGSFVLADPTVQILDEPNAEGLCPLSTLGCYMSIVEMTDFSLVSDSYSLTGTGSFRVTWHSATQVGPYFDWGASLFTDAGGDYMNDGDYASWSADSPYDLPSSTGGWLLFHNPPYLSYPRIRIENAVAVVPLPAAVWFFGSGLLGLVGISRKKRI